MQDSVQQYWIRREFALLDALAEEWRTKGARTASGYWKLTLLYDHLDSFLLAQAPTLFPHGEDWTSIDRWIEERPESPTPIILKALMLLRQAQNCYVPPRTAGVRRVAPESYNQTFVKAARDLLEEHKWASRDPHWHTAYLRALRFAGVSDDELLLAHAEALAAHPVYYETHFEMFRDFAQRWYPNFKMIDGFANTVLQGTRALEGHMVYARLYQDAWTLELNNTNPFTPTRAVWDRLRTGFEELNAAYPTDWNAQHFAYSACMAQDTSTVSRLFQGFKGLVVREAWQSSIFYKHCRDMATR